MGLCETCDGEGSCKMCGGEILGGKKEKEKQWGEWENKMRKNETTKFKLLYTKLSIK